MLGLPCCYQVLFLWLLRVCPRRMAPKLKPMSQCARLVSTQVHYSQFVGGHVRHEVFDTLKQPSWTHVHACRPQVRARAVLPRPSLRPLPSRAGRWRSCP